MNEGVKKISVLAVLACILMLCQPYIVMAQPPDLQWQKCLGGSQDDYANSIQQTLDGGYIVAGRAYSNDGDVIGNHGGSYPLDFWVVKLSNTGSLQWQKCLGGSGIDMANSIRQTSDGGYIVAGETSSNNGDVIGNQNSPGSDFWVVKLSNAGNIQWQKCLGGNAPGTYDNSQAYSVQQTTDGGYIVAGMTQANNGDAIGNHGDWDFWVVKLSDTGSLQWQKCLGGSSNDRGYSIQQTSDGGYIVAGYTSSNDGDVIGNHGVGISVSDAWVVKLSDTGSLQWQKCLGGSLSDEAWSVQQTTDGGYIVAGRTKSSDGDVTGNHGGFDSWVVKLSDTGSLQWQKCLGGTEYELANSVRQTSDGGYIVAGSAMSNNGDVTGNHGNRDFWVVKLSDTGSLQWQKSLGGLIIDEAKSIQQTTDGGYIVAGETNSNDGDVIGNHGTLSSDFWVVKIEPENIPPTISTQPSSQNVCAGSSTSFSVVATGTDLSYQWKKGGLLIDGATASELLFGSVKSEDEGTYTVDVSNSYGTVTSEEATLTVRTSPTIRTQPSSKDVCIGSSASFSVVATGTDLAYQWKKGSSTIEGATGSTLQINPVKAEDAGTYTVDVSNSCGTITSSGAALTIRSAPIIITQPSSQEVCTGSSTSFSVVATGPDLTYQWRKGDSPIDGATAATLLFSSVEPEDVGTYTVDITNNCGTITSSEATLAVRIPPTIGTQPVNEVSCSGTGASFSVIATGTEPLSYQWMLNDTAITGANSHTYTIPSVSTSDAGSYKVVVSNACGSVDSDTVTLTVNSPPPTITTQPAETVTGCEGQPVSFSVEANDALYYQWMKGSEPIEGAVWHTYTIPSAGTDDVGSYKVLISNCCGSEESDSVDLTVNEPPTITGQPSSQTISEGQSISFSVTAIGTDLSYQWKKDNSIIDGATQSTLSIDPVKFEDAGTYTVDVTNNCGSVTSNKAVLTVTSSCSPPKIISQTIAQRARIGQSVTFRVTVTGSEPLSYIWTKNGQTISGATSNTYTIPKVTLRDAGKYCVVVSNGCGKASACGTLIVGIFSSTVLDSTDILSPPLTNEQASQEGHRSERSERFLR